MLDGSSGFRETGCGARPLAEVIVVRLRTFYKVKGEGFSLFTFSRDAERKNTILAAWEASLNGVEAVGFVNEL